jgi:hypothetical protein
VQYHSQQLFQYSKTSKGKSNMWRRTVLFLVLLSIVERSAAEGSEDILTSIRAKHERIGQCRIRCLHDFAIVPTDSDCQRRPNCKSCWQTCSDLISLKSRQKLICKSGSQICERGCQSVCNFLEEEKLENRQPKQINSTPVELSTSFVGCTLYWKTSGDQSKVFVHQLYGMDSQVKLSFLTAKMLN